MMYLRRNILPCLSFGSQLLDTTTGRVFSVVACHKLSPYHQLVQLRLLFVSTPLPCIAIDWRIEWPNLGWKLLTLCGTESKPDLTYLDQRIPTPMNLKVPQSWNEADILFCTVPTTLPIESLRPLLVHDYWDIVKRSQLLSVFSRFQWNLMRNARAKEVRQLLQHDLQLAPRFKVTAKE